MYTVLPGEKKGSNSDINIVVSVIQLDVSKRQPHLRIVQNLLTGITNLFLAD